MTAKLKKCIRKKFHLFNLFRRGIVSRRDYNFYKNRLAYVTNKIKKLHYMRKFENARDVKESWSHINCLLRRKKKDFDLQIKGNNGIFLHRQILTNFINDYFVSYAIFLLI